MKYSIHWSLILLTAWSTSLAADQSATDVEFFEKRIRPILVDQCLKCHGPDKHKGGLVLTDRSRLIQGGDSGPAVVPGDPDKSLLVRAIRYTDEHLRMPPKSKLADTQITDLTEWVRRGVVWPEKQVRPAATAATGTAGPSADLNHWAWSPLKVPRPPGVERPAGAKSPIDTFILGPLEAKGISPAHPADKRTWIRRVTFDLTGLPPTRLEIEGFLADESPLARVRVVDRLLASPRYGERWGRHWLDLVRFAETSGHEFDYDIPYAHLYRDYVIRALNNDLPYDRFVTEHITGDLLARPRRHPVEGTNESILATGFWFLGESKHSPVDIRLDEADRFDNQIDVYGKTFLALTISCARCHDHKFDPIPSRDYYGMFSHLASSRVQQAFLDHPDRFSGLLQAIAGHRRRIQTYLVQQTAARLEHRLARLEDYLLAAAAGGRAVTHTTSVQAGLEPAILESLNKSLQSPDAGRANHPLHVWRVLAPPAKEVSRDTFRHAAEKLAGDLLAPSGRRGGEIDFPVHAATGGWTTTGQAFSAAESWEFLSRKDHEPQSSADQIIRPRMPHSGLISNKLFGTLRSPTFVIPSKKIWYRVAGRKAAVHLIIHNMRYLRDPIYGGLAVPVDTGGRFIWRGQDVSMWQGHRAHLEIVDEGDGYIALDRVVFGADGPPLELPNPLVVELLADKPPSSPKELARKYRMLFEKLLAQWKAGALDKADGPSDRAELLNWLLADSPFGQPNSNEENVTAACQPPLDSLLDQLRRLEAELPTPRRGLGILAGSPWAEKVHVRGNPRTPGEVAPSGFLAIFETGRSSNVRRSMNRLELAASMVETGRPLLARVIVNRLWQHHFGQGLVRNPDNFGRQGERPTHPELLDYLANMLLQSGWSLKALHRAVLLSETYGMANHTEDARAESLDPDNRFLHRMPVRRLEAEAVRDAILSVSGELSSRMHGRGPMPYLTPHMAGRGRPDQSGPLDGEGRRSIYLNVRRNFLSPFFLAFDYPVPFTTMGRRSVSNVPAQALAMMNNPFVVQQARLWAGKVLARPEASQESRIESLFIEAFGRPPSEAELQGAASFLHEQTQTYGPDRARAAWQDLCHVLLNVKEFIFVK